MIDKYVVEYTFETEEGKVRHESFEIDSITGVKRLVNVKRGRKGETIIHIDVRFVKTLF